MFLQCLARSEVATGPPLSRAVCPEMKKLFSKKVKEPEHEAQRSSNRGNAVMAGHSAQFAASTVGWLCGSGVDDWSRTLELCEGCSSSQKIAEESIRALRKEIEYGQPDAQQRAARLLVIMSRNTTDRFKLQMANKRFLEWVLAPLSSAAQLKR